MTQDIYPLTPLQESLLYVSQLQEDAYVVQSAFEISYPLRSELVGKALELLTDRHDLLRTAFVFEGLKRPYQVLLAERSLPFRTVSLTELADEEAGKQTAQLLAAEREQPFLLAKEPLLRVLLISLRPDRFVMAWTNHHILMDARSLQQLTSEFYTVYQMLEQMAPVTLPAPGPFKRYVEWIEAQNKREADAYWKTYLEGFTQPASLAATLRNRQAGKSQSQWEEVALRLTPELSKQLGEVAIAQNVTMSTLLQVTWAVLLGRFNQTSDVIFGTVSTVRPAELLEMEQTIGLFTNTVPVRIGWEPTDNLSSLVKQAQRAFWRSLPAQHLPLSEVQAHTPLKNRLFDHLFVVDGTYSASESQPAPGFVRPLTDTPFTQIDYDFSVLALINNRVTIRFTYNSNRYENWFFENIAEQYQYLLEQLVADPFCSVNDLGLIPAGQEAALRQMMVNDTHYQQPNGLYELFAQVVDTHGDSLAIRTPSGSYTYRQLKQQASQVANYLNDAFGVTAGDAVVVWADRSVEQVVAWLALLKLGAIYVPIDGRSPQARVEQIIQQTQPRLVLTDDSVPKPDTGVEAVSISHLVVLATAIPDAERTVVVDPAHVAYVIFTSGTTGSPKGVQIMHQSFGSRIRYHIDYLSIQATDRVLYLASVGFDASLVEIGMALFAGATLIIADASIKDNPVLLTEYLDETGVTVAIFPPAYLQALGRKPLPSLTRIITTGEEARLAESLFYAETKRVINGYGPTETCVGATFFDVQTAHQADYEALGQVPIGLPFADTTVYVLDEHLALLPEGAIGDIYVAGLGLAVGYVGDRTLTQEKFIDNPFQPGTGLYRTGDRGRWHRRWGLEFLGRQDKQVQVRGVRLELQEIETGLHAFDGIDAAYLTTQPSGEGEVTLVAYVEAKKAIDELTLRAFLRQRLPAYAIPSLIIPVFELPRTANGKIDSVALPAPSPRQHHCPVVEPRYELERELLTIWEETLGCTHTGVTHNFFDLGGHSLKAMRLVSQLYKRMGVKLNTGEVLHYPTVAQLATRIASVRQEEAYSSIRPLPEQTYYEVSAAQRRMWMLSQFAGAEAAYHIQMVYQLDGLFDPALFEAALRQVVMRHEILRTSFHFVNDDVKQTVSSPETCLIPFRYKTGLGVNDIATFLRDEQQGSFALDRPSQFRVSIAGIGADRYLLTITIHHILVDGASLQQLSTELLTLYRALVAGESIRVSPLKLHYKDFAYWQNHQLDSRSVQTHRDYWLSELAALPDRPLLPTDVARPAQKSFVGHRVSASIRDTAFRQLKQWSVDQQTSLYTVLMASLYTLLYRYSGQNDLLVGTPVSLRQHPDLDGQIGLYLNTLAIRTEVNPDEPFAKLVKTVAEKLLLGDQHLAYPFDQLMADLKAPSGQGESSLFDVMLSHQYVEPATGLSEGQPLTVSLYPAATRTQSKFDWEFFCFENPQSLELSLVVDADLYKPETAQTVLERFVALLHTVTHPANVVCAVGHLPFLLTDEKSWLLAQSKAQPRLYPARDFVEAFRQQVQQTPQATAYAAEKMILSYRQADEASDRLSAYIQTDCGIKPGDVVGLLMPRSVHFMTAMLAVLKAGATFMPLDVNYPSERLKYMLDNAKASLVLTDTSVLTWFNAQPVPMLPIDDKALLQAGSAIPPVSWPGDRAAYIIYTSGSTGQPKGAAITMDNLMNYLGWSNEYYFNHQSGYDMGLFTSVAFDLTITTLLTPLLRGDAVRISHPDASIETVLTQAFAPDSGVSAMKMTPSHVLLLTYTGLTATDVSHIILGGEPLYPEHVQILRSLNKHIRIFNEYGPTETTVGCAVEEVLSENDPITIGRPIANTHIQLLTAEGELVPRGGVGELYIGGKGVGLGYVHQPELTAKAFVSRVQWPEERLYKTGDLGRWLADGRLEYLGRKDKQVKINGYRIETAEVENQLRRVLHTEQVAVNVAAPEQGGYLQAFIKWQDGPLIDDAMIRQQLRQWLPDYMVPARFIPVTHFPLTLNGKLDYSQLVAAPLPVSMEEQPRNEVEHWLLTTWESILNVPPSGIRTNFFFIGGHSIKAIQLQHAIQQHWGCKLPLNDIYQHPTIAELADVIQAVQAVKNQLIDEAYEEFII